MTRLISGVAGGRVLRTPKGTITRPTAGQVRAAVFSALGSVTGARVLDLYAGSGSVGLEALSRGAACAVLVEREAQALLALRANVTALALPGAQVVADAVERYLAGGCPGDPFDVVYLDPPYRDPVGSALGALVSGGWLGDQGRVVVERAARDPSPVWPPGLEGHRDRRYGDTRLWYGLRS